MQRALTIQLRRQAREQSKQSKELKNCLKSRNQPFPTRGVVNGWTLRVIYKLGVLSSRCNIQTEAWFSHCMLVGWRESAGRLRQIKNRKQKTKEKMSHQHKQNSNSEDFTGQFQGFAKLCLFCFKCIKTHL